MPTDARELRDELLVLRCQLGEPKAFNELIRRWEGRLLYYLRRLVPQEADAWDALQRTWLAVFRDVRHLKEPRALRAWLYRVARNQAASHCRHERLHRSRVDEEADPDGIAESDWTPAVDEAERVHAALALLSLSHREVVALTSSNRCRSMRSPRSRASGGDRQVSLALCEGCPQEASGDRRRRT